MFSVLWNGNQRWNAKILHCSYMFNIKNEKSLCSPENRNIKRVHPESIGSIKNRTKRSSHIMNHL